MKLVFFLNKDLSINGKLLQIIVALNLDVILMAFSDIIVDSFWILIDAYMHSIRFKKLATLLLNNSIKRVWE